ncbi:hypothetical protein YC2023_021674 [Brassica napus]
MKKSLRSKIVLLSRSNRHAVHLEMGKFMTQEDDKAEAQEDEIVVKEPEVEKKQNWNRSLENRRRGCRKVSRIKRWIMLRTRTRKTAIKHYSKKALDISERQKQEEGGC